MFPMTKTKSSRNIANELTPDDSVMRGWWSFMTILACVTFSQTRSIVAAVGAFFCVPALAIVQGAIGIIRYRVLYGNAPLPLSPAHGVVVVKPDDDDNDDSTVVAASCANQEHSTGCGCLGGRRWRNTTQVTDSERLLLQKALKEPPIRLLVIGDSLSIGVGTSRSCTPMLPEIVAQTVSKALGGRAVYWSCHGEPGASAGWIVRELERGVGSTSCSHSSATTTLNGSMSNGDVSLADTSMSSYDDEDIASDGTLDEDEQDLLPTEWQVWRDRLDRHRKRFDPHVLGPYDIAVVFSGSNDIKGAFFPFLLKGDAVHFHKQAKERGGNYAHELRLVLDVLRHRMKEGIDEIRDNLLEHLHPHSNSPPTKVRQQVDTTDGDTTSSSSSSPNEPIHSSTNGPLIVLPGLPARALPIFRPLPLRWFAVPVVDKLDNHKRDLAKSHPGEVIFVEPLAVASIVEYEEQRGPMWEQRECEDTLLALRSVDRSTCQRIETEMRLYYTENLDQTVPQHNAPVPPLSQRLGRPGSKIFSKDQVHPNDEGYDLWARCIGNAIVKEWKKSS